ncbi:hypothetical protein QQS21_000307 [Conoideocrella luteorostrata]|uniref:Uncharacterized protein n=1 Tax=Conoideocrella luteorostrata TaxID=1105319 RepID=A0AAJ0D1C5_9HYPO|nr:hypothetical protein QQS21_000307 [Conoideocrella luteorostrata]
MAPSPARRTTLLDLSSEIRRRIYLDAGIITGSNIELMPREPQTRVWCDETGDFHMLREKSLDITYSLLLVCKVVSAEVKALVFATNGIIVNKDHVDSGLDLLHSLADDICSGMRDLYVHLQVWGGISPDYIRQRRLPPKPLTLRTLNKWKEAITHILSRVKPNLLFLHIIFDVVNEDSQLVAVMEPVYHFPGVLKGFEVRYSLRRRPRFGLNKYTLTFMDKIQGSLARNIGKRDPKEPFRFLDLPAEIKRSVLLYTDLITPNHRVQWNHDNGFHIQYAPCECAPETISSSFSLDVPPQSRLDLPLHQTMESVRYEKTGLFCSRFTSGFFSRCSCWRPPRPLFLVCKAMYWDAIRVFYSMNRVVIPINGRPHGERDRNFDNVTIPTLCRLDCSRFFTRHMWPEALQYLRTIELVLPPVSLHTHLHPSEPVYLDWRAAIHHLSRFADIRSLKVIIFLTSKESLRDEGTEFRKKIYEGEYHKPTLLCTYTQLLDPLRQFTPQMQQFIIHLEWPWYWPARGLTYQTNDSDWEVPVRLVAIDKIDPFSRVEELETWLENYVVGIRPQNEAVDKTSVQASDWLLFAIDRQDDEYMQLAQ